jgi:hypothetical protein
MRHDVRVLQQWWWLDNTTAKPKPNTKHKPNEQIIATATDRTGAMVGVPNYWPRWAEYWRLSR